MFDADRNQLGQAIVIVSKGKLELANGFSPARNGPAHKPATHHVTALK
jgi:hypothetical protein